LNSVYSIVVWLIVVTVALCSCAKKDFGILDAASSEEVQETSGYPAVVMVVLPQGQGMCTGTFISPRAVLTAAHCTPVSGTYTVYTSFGTFETSEKRVLGPGVVDDPSDISILVFDHDVADPAHGRVYGLGSAPVRGDKIRVVGFGCNDLDARSGAGKKRTGTNRVFDVGEYVELYTTPTDKLRASHASRNILGPDNQAGSCFGDSGGPMLQIQGGVLKLVGVTHAGGWDNEMIRSLYVDLNRNANVAFFQNTDNHFALNLYDGCWTSDEPDACGALTASMRLFAFLERFWLYLVALF